MTMVLSVLALVLASQTFTFDICFKTKDVYLKYATYSVCLTPSQTTFFSLFQTESVCNFKFDENGRKFSKRVENTVGKGEIARYEQFLLFPQCF